MNTLKVVHRLPITNSGKRMAEVQCAWKVRGKEGCCWNRIYNCSGVDQQNYQIWITRISGTEVTNADTSYLFHVFLDSSFDIHTPFLNWNSIDNSTLIVHHLLVVLYFSKVNSFKEFSCFLSLWKLITFIIHNWGSGFQKKILSYVFFTSTPTINLSICNILKIKFKCPKQPLIQIFKGWVH